MPIHLERIVEREVTRRTLLLCIDVWWNNLIAMPRIVLRRSRLLAVQRPPLHRCMVEPCRVASERPSSLSGLFAVQRPPRAACLVVLDVGVRLSAERSPQICVMSGQIPEVLE